MWTDLSSCFCCALCSDLPASPLPPQTYLEIFVYCLGFFIIIILMATAVICRLCCAPKKSEFSNQLVVQKLIKNISLRRQVRRCVKRWVRQPVAPCMTYPLSTGVN